MPTNLRARVTAADFGTPPKASARAQEKLIHQALVLHFMVQLSLVEDVEPSVAARGMGRVHHRILYFAHFRPGITVGELLGVLGVKHQNIQAPLRQLVKEGYVLARTSSADHRLKQLYCSRKGDKVLDHVSIGQRERIRRAYENVSPRDVESYLKVMTAMLGSNRRDWARRLTERDDPSDPV